MDYVTVASLFTCVPKYVDRAANCNLNFGDLYLHSLHPSLNCKATGFYSQQGWGQVQFTKYSKCIPSTSTGQVLIF